jgi:hypothetical protein
LKAAFLLSAMRVETSVLVAIRGVKEKGEVFTIATTANLAEPPFYENHREVCPYLV